MNFRSSLLFSVAFVTIAGIAHAQSREDLLDQLTRHIQLCAEITDSQQRLACYDKVQNNVGGTPAPQAGNRAPPAPVPMPAPTPTPIPSTPPAASGGGSYSTTPLSPPPLTTPGGGVATIGGSSGESSQPNPPPSGYDPDRAFDPNAAAGGESGGGAMTKPQPPVRRTGPRPLPRFTQPMPLVTLTASNLTYGASRYWQVSISVTSNTPNTVNTQIQCTFRNAGRSVGDAYFGPVALAPGEQISTDLIGPPTSTYVDSTNCRVVSP